MASTFNANMNCAVQKPQPSLLERAISRVSMLSYEGWISGMSNRKLTVLFALEVGFFLWALAHAI